MKSVLWLAAMAAAGIVVACGGNVVVDGGGGNGGVGAAGTTTGNPGSGGAGASCATPPPAGLLNDCTTSVTVGPGAPSQCSSSRCDAQGNRYESQCTSTSCACLFNGHTVCSCAIEGNGDICLGTAPSCCPVPFPK